MKQTYAGIPEENASLENSKVMLVTVPYDGTSTWGKGADKGPELFLDASENMELYDIETGTEPYLEGVYLAGEVTEDSSPEAMTEAVYQKTKELLKHEDKLFTLFGGEHSVSIGSIRAVGEKYENLTVLQLDAHTDLRPEFHGSTSNHACAVFEASQKHNLVQVGIRSMDAEEMQYVPKGQCFWAHEIAQNPNWIDEVLEKVSGNVYITIDLDAFDPSIAPSTGTPEPGGLAWYPTLELLKKVFEKCNVVAFDIVELMDSPMAKPTAFLAAKLYYKMLAYYHLANKK
ncbi:agmatinase [Riemerella anatipestifer]|nr:agmatinase [Riemerella anatipestifer]AKP71996.1 arginase/agmatinase/formimionoglutamate hydrolase [Riemerella anatipestifer]AKQ40455.1 agmatinase [Riemerella anatipestifer Yb2]AZZ59750.1 agmatinase [Riemerella anatipestifer]MBT0526027.1 agmatinase [Riemerella anatipestifer]MBT0527894.1 agmatinase [Riemerella anatipestifer]